MPSIPGFWDIGPHDPIPVEPTWQEFVLGAGGEIVSRLIPEPRTFENADFIFKEVSVLAELKEIETEFSGSEAFRKGFDELMNRVLAEDPNWKPVLFGGTGNYPAWFNLEFVRLFRPPISRILKKANRQLRDTKKHFGIRSSTGVLVLANNGFTAIGPELVRALAAQLLVHSYSSIDCLVYITVNRYVELQGSDVPRLMWAPTYSDRAPGSLVTFIDNLGRKWFDFLERKIGPFTIRDSEPENLNSLRGSRSIVLPGERRG
ncbi:hypothetical protein EZJ19_07935 [Parasulfuritortus cantonensis]|uniref:Uncharacterized protein n=1 Tax=Parasulfuritortus cantonensis TaxID=2528202 RepID=A0A4R1BE04_9PROT|nr:hypothetical protein [Parasulfuritortus cantonensis]TCJ15228.1 hypothetical protein EZJ19_07935 [Parasulfuritortus cantonensis]